MKIIDCIQGSEAWYLARLGVPSASNFKRIVTNTLDANGTYKMSGSLNGYAAELAAEVFAGKTLDQFDGNFFMNRGKENEAEARALYAFTNDVEVQEVGFVTTDDGLAGCSPDGLMADGGGLEIKMQKAENHLKTVEYFKKHGTAEPKYTQQVQGGLWVTGLAYWAQLFYHPDLPPLVIRQKPDAAERDAQLASLRRHQTHIPEGVTL